MKTIGYEAVLFGALILGLCGLVAYEFAMVATDSYAPHQLRVLSGAVVLGIVGVVTVGLFAVTRRVR